MTDDLPIVKSIKMVRESDIVEQLRNSNDRLLMCGQDYSDVVLDAATEIERLRKAVDKMTHHLLQFQPSDDFQHDHMVIVKLKSTDIEEIWGFLPQPPKEKNDGQGVS